MTPVSIPSVALGTMAKRLAVARLYKLTRLPDRVWSGEEPSRDCMCPGCFNYFTNIDRLSRGKKP
jgi:hypothetical protein